MLNFEEDHNREIPYYYSFQHLEDQLILALRFLIHILFSHLNLRV